MGKRNPLKFPLIKSVIEIMILASAKSVHVDLNTVYKNNSVKHRELLLYKLKNTFLY